MKDYEITVELIGAKVYATVLIKAKNKKEAIKLAKKEIEHSGIDMPDVVHWEEIDWENAEISHE